MSKIYFNLLIKRALDGCNIEYKSIEDKKGAMITEYHDVDKNKVFRLTIEEVNRIKQGGLSAIHSGTYKM